MISESEVKYDAKKMPLSTSKVARSVKSRFSKPVIELKKCEKNYSCYVFCPKDAVDITDAGNPAINASLCDGCLICLRLCPFVAIGEQNER